MSANAEDSDGSVRVTRRSMRRMGSVESVNEAVDTPTLPPRNKPLKTISELAGTPKTSLLASPRRTRKNSEEPVAVGSPFRRTTRASSQDKDVTASPLPTRASRRSAVAESDTDDAASTPAKGKADRTKRKSTIASPKIAQIVEEPEDDNEKELLEEDEKAKELDSSNDLELRTRSITKSPSASPPKPSLNGSLNSSKKSNGHLDSSIEEPEVMKVFKSRNAREAKTSVTEISFHDSDTEALPAKSYSNAVHQSLVVQKTTFEGCLERISNSEGKKHPLSESFEQELDAGTQKDGSEKVVSVNNTPVRGRRSIHDSDSTSDDTPKMKAKLEDLAKMRESFVAKDSPKSAKKSPVAEVTPARTPKSAKKTAKADESDEVSKLMEDFVDETADAVETPKSSQKLGNGTPARDKTPKSAKKASKTKESDEVTVLMEDSVYTTAETVFTPKNAKKLANGTPGRVKTPKSEKKTAATPHKSLRYSSEPMDISPDGQLDATVHDSLSMDTEMIDAGEARDMEMTLTKSGSPQKAPTPKSEKKYSIFQHVKDVAKSSKRLSVASLPNCGSDKEESDEEDASKLRRKSWAVSVTRPATEAVDTAAKSKSPVVIKGQDQRVKGYSSDEAEEDDEESKNSFLDDEAEVGDEESITESEANYIREHEVPDDGESIGSEDTDPEDDLDDEEEGSSFLATDDEGIDQYSMNSSEEELEELAEKPKRKSRIIEPSSSEDEEVEVEKSPAKAAKSPAKSPKSASKKFAPEVEFEDEPEVEDELQAAESPEKPSPPSRKSTEAVVEPEEAEQVEERVSKKTKRRRESDLNGSVTVKPKRARMSDTSVVETPDNTTGLAELFEEHTDDQPVKVKKAKKPKQPEAVDLEKVQTTVEDYMSKYIAEKKANMALKREKKAQKQALKLKEAEEAAKLAAEGLDSSNNSNKENALAPKKKNKSKIKKQKLVAEMPEEKESLAETVSKAQEKLERKRQRKLEKKLAKQQQQQSAESETAKEVEEAPVPTKKSKTAAKPVEPETAPEPVVEKKKSKKAKVVESLEEPENAPVEPSKKKKKQKELVAEVEQPAAVPEKKKKKKVVVEEPALEPVLKTKKRKLDDSVDESAVQPKKKLNVLQQIEHPFQYQPQARTSRNDNQDQLSIPLMSQKLKKVIPQKVEIEKKHKKKKAPGGKKSIPEPRKSLPRPIFTTAGTFIEAPISPFKFQSTTYVPIAKTASLPTSYGVVAFEAKKKKHAQQQQPAPDFKTQMMYRNMKARDGSMKNLVGLVHKQHSL